MAGIFKKRAASEGDVGYVRGDEFGVPSGDEDALDPGDDSQPEPEAPGRTNQILLIVALLTVIAVLIVGFFVVREIAGERAPETMAEAKIADLEAQVKLNPTDPNLRLRLVEAYFVVQDYDEARYHLDEMYSQEVTGTVLAMTLYADARIEQAQGNLDEAVDLYKESIELFDYGDTHYALAMAYIEAEQWDDAIATLTKYLEVFPTDSGALVQVGKCYEAQGDTAKALEMYKQALTYIPDDPEITAEIERLEGR